MGSLLFPTQLGFGTPMGAEATVHAARSYLNGMIQGNLLVKLDFQNAFNSIRRDSMLKSVLEKASLVFPLAFTSYCQPSSLFFSNYIIHSCEGVQQGDPLGPLLFCLAIHDLITLLKSEFNVFYLDDGTLGGSLKDIKVAGRSAHAIFAKTFAVISMLLNDISATTPIYLIELTIRPV